VRFGYAPRATLRHSELLSSRQAKVSAMSANPIPSAESTTAQRFNLLIGGKLVPGAMTLDVVNPATGKVFATCARADKHQLDAAVAAAKGAFPAWSATPLAERRRLLLKLADGVAARTDEFARLLTQEQGKPLAIATREMKGAVWSIRKYASLDLPLKTLKEDEHGRVVRRQAPLGVVAAITAWNFPMTLTMNKVPPALLAGNTVVLKPAPTTPLTTLLVAELCADIFPPGVVNVIVDQNDLGGHLTTHRDVAKVTFTGSTATGKKVMASVAESVKRVTLELGGNDAAILLDDVNVKEVAPKVFQAAMHNAGQVCIAIKRVYVHDSKYDALCEELAKLAAQVVVGNGLDEGTTMGPVQNKAQFEKVKEFLVDAHAHGKVIAGGKALDRDGYFIAPTIVRDIPDDARLVREEQFGPVLPVLKYSDVTDAITRANDTEYGLGSSVWSADPERAFAVAQQIGAGTVWVNKHLDIPPEGPFGGAKQSGFGCELGQEGLEQFTQTQIISVAR
jgi:acyl-CoA reductase-like NAD-dependent aldehyde dehydrogenase